MTPAAATPPRVVLDTNVLLDLWLFDDASVGPLRAALAAGRLVAVRSAACDAEFADVLGRPRFGLDAGARAAVLARWTACSEALADIRAAPLACTDPDDQKFLDAAFSSGAALLLTRDDALLRLACRAAPAGLRICRPRALGEPAAAAPAADRRRPVARRCAAARERLNDRPAPGAP